MTRSDMTRRSFVSSTTAAAFLVALPGCGPADPQLGERERGALTRLARLLYPHESLADDIYAEVLRPLRERAENDGSLQDALREGLERLDRLAGQDWRTAPVAAQIEALKLVEGEPFFAMVQTAVREQLYELPEVWQLIGYGGPSVGHGGYIARGFDDIDWLPEG